MAEKEKTDIMVLKEFFGLSVSESRQVIKDMPEPERAALATGIRDGSLTY